MLKVMRFSWLGDACPSRNSVSRNEVGWGQTEGSVTSSVVFMSLGKVRVAELSHPQEVGSGGVGATCKDLVASAIFPSILRLPFEELGSV